MNDPYQRHSVREANRRAAKRADRLFIAGFVTIAVIGLAFAAAVVFVALHFLLKVW